MPDLSPTPVFSMGLDAVMPGAIVVGLVAVLVYAGATASAKGERNRRAGLGLASILGGPVVGAVLAWARVVIGRVHPDDIKLTLIAFSALGAIAGLIAGVAFAASAAIAPGDAGKPPGESEL